MTDDNIKPDALSASLQTMERLDNDIEFVVRLSNSATRALHYISDVRATKYDPATKTLTLSLSDEGREVIPSTIGKLPVFRYIDPGSDAEIRLRVPNKVIKLSRTAPPGKLAFETHQLSDVEEVVIEVAWADVPYYKDTRITDDMRLPAARWQKHKARATKRLKVDRRQKGKSEQTDAPNA
jgi:hypothetical protein